MVAMAFALVFALAAVVLTVLLHDAPERAIASERAATTETSGEPLTRGKILSSRGRKELDPCRPPYRRTN